MTAQASSDVNAEHEEHVNHPKHYNTHPSDIECVEFSELLPGNLSHVCVYVWRYENKGTPKRDLEKAVWFLERELGRTASEREETLAMLKINRVRHEDRLRGLRVHSDFTSEIVKSLFVETHGGLEISLNKIRQKLVEL